LIVGYYLQYAILKIKAKEKLEVTIEYLLNNKEALRRELIELVTGNVLRRLFVLSLISSEGTVSSNNIKLIQKGDYLEMCTSLKIDSNLLLHTLDSLFRELHKKQGGVKTIENEEKIKNNSMEIDDDINIIQSVVAKDKQPTLNSKSLSALVDHITSICLVNTNSNKESCGVQPLISSSKKEGELSDILNIEFPSKKTKDYTITIEPSKFKFSLIELPKTLIKLYEKYFQVKCTNCNTAPTFSLICLLCGTKICFMRDCCNNLGKKKNTYEYIQHAIQCGLGNSAYLHLDDGKVSFVLNKIIAYSSIYLYTNKFYEHPSNKKISSEYKLNGELYQQVIEEFLSFKCTQYLKKNLSMNNREDDGSDVEFVDE